jgi:hypothetical protein
VGVDSPEQADSVVSNTAKGKAPKVLEEMRIR